MQQRVKKNVLKLQIITMYYTYGVTPLKLGMGLGVLYNLLELLYRCSKKVCDLYMTVSRVYAHQNDTERFM